MGEDVVRLEGNNVAAGKATLAASGLKLVAGDSMADAAQKIVAAVGFDAGDRAGRTPLFFATDMHTLEWLFSRPVPRPSGELDSPDIVAKLLGKGANVNARLTGRPFILHHNATGNRTITEGATALMKAGAHVFSWPRAEGSFFDRPTAEGAHDEEPSAHGRGGAGGRVPALLPLSPGNLARSRRVAWHVEHRIASAGADRARCLGRGFS